MRCGQLLIRPCWLLGCLRSHWVGIHLRKHTRGGERPNPVKYCTPWRMCCCSCLHNALHNAQCTGAGQDMAYQQADRSKGNLPVLCLADA